MNPEIDATEELDEMPQAPAQKPKRRLGLWLFLVLALAGLGAGGWFGWTKFAAADTEATAAEIRPGARSNAQYLPLEPAMVINFSGSGQLRYLQVSVEVMASDARGLESLRRHTPPIRNALIALFSELDYQALLTRAGKEELRLEALEVIRTEMTQLTGQPVAEDVYFTSFVMQ